MGNDQGRMCASLWDEGGEQQQSQHKRKKSKKKKKKKGFAPAKDTNSNTQDTIADVKTPAPSEGNPKNNNNVNNNNNNNNQNSSNNELADLDLNDPELEAATVKIQAAYRGFATRKKHAKLGRKVRKDAAEKRQWEREASRGELNPASPVADEPGNNVQQNNNVNAPSYSENKVQEQQTAPPQQVKQQQQQQSESSSRQSSQQSNNNVPKQSPVYDNSNGSGPNAMQSAAVVESPPQSYRSGVGDDMASGFVVIELNKFQGLEKPKNVYVVFDIEELDDGGSSTREERKSRTIKSQEPEWDQAFEKLPVDDITVQALRINLYEKRTMFKDTLLGFADIDLGNLSPDVIGEVETELENSKHELWGLLTLTVQFIPNKH